jgi:hypothetical protein
MHLVENKHHMNMKLIISGFKKYKDMQLQWYS